MENAADALVGFGASEEAASLLRVDGDQVVFIGGGFSVDLENFSFNAEYSTFSIEDALFLDNQQWYVMAAYRIGEFQPFVMYETTENDKNTETAANFPAPLQPGVQRAFDAQEFSYDGITAGFRYDFHPQAAFKLQYTAFSNIVDISGGGGAGSYGTPDNKESLGLLQTSVDFMF